MIFGNPGIYDKNGNISNFAILVEHINNDGFFSVNLCIDMSIYPRKLAYHSGEYISIGLRNEEILINENEFLFKLDENDLLAELVRMKFNDLYQVECLIRDDLIDYSKLLDEDYIYDLIDYDYETNDECYWEIDNIEYGNVFPFIINFSGYSKVVIIMINEGSMTDGLMSRFFNSMGGVNENKAFFDKAYWSINTAILRTDDLRIIMKSAYDYIIEYMKR